MVAAIDFTASNGDPQTETSNHFCSQKDRNHYEKALLDVGSVIEIDMVDPNAGGAAAASSEEDQLNE